MSFHLLGKAQTTPTENKQITIVHGGDFSKNEIKYPGASIFSKDDRQVQFEHLGADLWCDIAIFYQKENKLRAIGNIYLQQGDSIQMSSGYIEYDGNTKIAKTYKNVILENTDMTLKTDTLYFNREKQEAFYQDFGSIVDTANTLTSKIGKLYMDTKKYEFIHSVHIENKKYTVDSENLNYYTDSKKAYMYGPSTIVGEDYKIYCERGFYDTNLEQGYGIKNTRIDYNDRIIKGDSLFFDQQRAFASATNNITVTDTINNGVIRAHYAEVHKKKDSIFATRRAVSISLVQKDSLYMHGDTLMVTGKKDNRIIRAYHNAKFFKTDLSGKADSIHVDEKTGITQLIKRPIIWNGENQMTGDSIHLISNIKTEKLDSLKVLNNAFIVSLDTISGTGYNQAKGINLFGRFEENTLKYIDLVKNTEVVYYLYNNKQELIGIDKTKCSRIEIVMNNNDVQDLTFITEPDGDISPKEEVPPNALILKGFLWRGDERIHRKEDIFDEDDNNMQLVPINGITAPIDPEIQLQQQKKKKDTNTTLPNTKLKAVTSDSKKGAIKLKSSN